MDVLTDQLTNAICELLKAQIEYDGANKEYDGKSWIWAGGKVIKNLDSAKKQLRKALDDCIDDRVKAKE
jgi:hypothetical protein